MNISSQEITRRLLFSKVLISVSLFFLFGSVRSQGIRIQCDDKPLNQILLELKTDHGLLVSFDDNLLSSFTITIDSLFQSPDAALDCLLHALPLKYEKTSGVYVIYSFRVKEKLKRYVLSGRVTDRSNGETLPFSGIQVNNTVLSSDLKGNFSFNSVADSVFKVRISYIGYYILDTVVDAGINHNLSLVPSVIAMKEILIEGSVIARTIQAGSSPGIARINHKIAYYLPGNGDNSVFNLLRLQPGILASGEQSSDLIIWGSYEGQSQIVFDGFTIYGMKNFNDNISSVNPYMAKDIKVMKGGFGAEYGERVGGIVDITGTDGDCYKPSARLSVNNMTMSGIASIPVSKNSALLTAYRQTYYELYNPVALSSSGYGRGRQSSQADYYLAPDYDFRDVNLKYSGRSSGTDYYLSLYGGLDNFSYDFNQETLQKTINLSHYERNLQTGGAGYYGFRWREKNSGSIIISFSSLQSDRKHDEVVTRLSGQPGETRVYDNISSSINEVSGKAESKLNISGSHRLDAGVGFIYYLTEKIYTDLSGHQTINNDGLALPWLYLQDNLDLLRGLTVRPGIRVDFHSLTGKAALQPRLSVLYRINDFLRLNSAAGLYNQFVAKNMIIGESGNFRSEWYVCDGSDTEILNAGSITMGISYDRRGFIVSAEGYMKRTGGITRLLETATSTEAYYGTGITKGFDLFVRKDFRDQTLWISYTLSRSLESFPYFTSEEYLPAMHDQRHEIKLAALTKFRALHFSVSYVFGSGFPDPDLLPDVIEYTRPYSRLDAALVYKLSDRKIKVDTGVSVLNVLNRENIRYSNYTRIPEDETTTISLYAEAVPLTPTLFLNIYF